MRLLFLVLFVLGLLGLASAAQAAGRVALVIGNSAYQKVGVLPNPSRDAEDLASALERIGFAVTLASDLDGAQMRDTLRTFRNSAIGSEMAVIYFAGHGIEIDSQNFIIPVDAGLETDSDVLFEAIPTTLLVEAVAGATGLRMVLLDACRNNPFVSQMQVTDSSRSIGRGLSPLEPTASTLVAYSAKAGTVALDGPAGQNSPFMKALLEHLEEPGLDIMLMMRRVRDTVLAETGNRQEPFTYGSLPGHEIYLVPEAEPAQVAGLETPPAFAPLATPQPVADPAEELAWRLVRESADVSAVRDFLRVYPSGLHAQEAIERLIALTSQTTPAVPAAETPAPEVGATPLPEVPADLAPVPEQPADAAPARVADVPEAALDTAPAATPEPVDQAVLIASIQQELSRAGCNPGPADGVWGRRSRAAVTAFADDAGINIRSLEPSEQLLRTLRSKSGVVCKDEEPEQQQAAAPATGPLDGLSAECRAVYREYEGEPGAKAFASDPAGDDCGWGANYGTLAEARRRAIDECPASNCTVIAATDVSATRVGGKRVAGQCVVDYQNYRRFGDHKAFAVSDDGLTCAWSFDNDSLATAHREALAGCTQHNEPGCEVVHSR